jgi:folate-dependent phosphoribosylglycinamide formyltransferase PurN
VFASRIHEAEHRIFPIALQKVLMERLAKERNE